MKRLFIFALTMMAASSSFAMKDVLQCVNGRVVVNTFRHMNEDQLRLTASFMVNDLGNFEALVTTQSRWTAKSFSGKTADGRKMKLVVKRFDDLKGTLSIEGLPSEELVCREQNLFEM